MTRCPVARVACLGVACVLLVGCASTRTGSPGGSVADAEAQVRAVVEGYVAARDARDIPAVRAALRADVDQLTSRGEWRRGIDAATAGMQRSTKQNPGTRTLAIETVRLLTDDVALVDARYTIANPGGEPRKLWSSFTVTRQAQGQADAPWQITAIRNMKPAE